jgi:hypothetical protein
VEEKHMRWLYRFGLCLGLDLLIAGFVLCVLFMALDPRAVAAGPKNEIRIVHPTKGAHISGKIHIRLEVGQNIKKVFVFIDDKYFASGPPHSIFWNSAKVSNGPHRITVAAAKPRISSNELFLASQSDTTDTTNFSVHNKPTATPTPTHLPSPAPAPLGGITPPTLVNPQNPRNYGADPTGTNDSTTAFQNALNAGDVLVPAGHFLITGHLYFPTNRHMQCTLSNGTSGVLQSFLVNTAMTGYQMIDMDVTTGSSIFYCGFRGPNADIASRPAINTNAPFFVRISGGAGGSTSNNQLVGNDFNGIQGGIGGVVVYAPAGDSAPSGTVISWNTFEHCGYYAVQVAAAQGTTTISHNTLNDCSGFVEGNVTSPATPNTGVVIDSNHLTFTYGIGATEPNCASLLGFCGFDGLTGGCSASGSAFNYSGNTVSNNIVDGTYHSTVLKAAVGGSQNDALYINNTCTGACVVDAYQ